MSSVTKTRREPHRELLLKKRAELLASTRSQPEALATSIQTPDAVEFAIKAAEQDLTAATAELRARMLKEIESALKRVANGTYGECEACGEEIPASRLRAIPWARFCVPCQEQHSKN